MSSIADAISMLEQVVREARDATDHLLGSAEAWDDAGELLRLALTGSRDPDAESLLAQFALIEDEFTGSVNS